MLQCGALSRPISDITPVYSITSAGVTSNADGTYRPKSWRSCLEGLACRKSVPSWLHGTIVHLQRAGPTMKTILVPIQNTPTMQSTRNGGAARAAHRRRYRGRSALVGMSRKCTNRRNRHVVLLLSLGEFCAKLSKDNLTGHKIEMATTSVLEERDIRRGSPSFQGSAGKIIKVAEHIRFLNCTVRDGLQDISYAIKSGFPPVDKD